MSFREEIAKRYGVIIRDEDVLWEDKDSFSFYVYDESGSVVAVGGWNRNTEAFWRNCQSEDK